MSTTKAAVLDLLNDHAPLVTAIGKKINPRENPKNATFPRVTYHRVSYDPTYECLSDEENCARVVETFEIVAHARTDQEAEEIAALIRAAIDAMDKDTTYADTNFLDAFVTNQVDITNFPVYDDDKPVYPNALTVDFHYERDCE